MSSISVKDMGIHDPQKTAAGHTILAHWRNSRAKRDLTQKFRAELLALPHKDFVKIWNSTMKPRIHAEPLFTQTREKMLARFQKERGKIERRFSYVVCTEVGSKTKPPKYSIRASLPKDAERLKNTSIYLTKEAKEQYTAMTKSPPQNKEELDQLVQILNGCDDLFPWKFTKFGCLPKAIVAADIFDLCGVPRENLRFRFVRIPQNYRARPFERWEYHCTLEALVDKKWYMCDGSLFPNGGIRFREWIKPQQNSVRQLTATKIKSDFSNLPSNTCHRVPYLAGSITSLSLPTNRLLQEITPKTIAVAELTPERRTTALERLASNRFQIEKQLLI